MEERIKAGPAMHNYYYNTVNIAEVATNWGEHYEKCLSLARNGASLKDWEKYVRRVVMPQYRKEVDEPFWGLTRESITEVAFELKTHYETSIKEGA